MTPQSSPEKGSMEDRFDKRFPNLGCDERDFAGEIEKNEVKSFIRSEVEAARRVICTMHEQVSEYRCTECDQGFDCQCRLKLESIIRERIANEYHIG